MGFRIEVSCNGYSPAVYVKAVGVMQVRQVVEEVAHSATHIKHHFRRGRGKDLHHAPAQFMRGEKLAHLEFFLGFRISVIAGKICLLEIVQSSDTCVAVVDALLRNEVLAGIDGKKDFLVHLGTLVPGNLLGYDGIHAFTF